MSFEENVVATLIGALGGFIGGLIIYFLKEARSTHTRHKSLVQNLKYELNYNITLYEDFSEKVQDCIESISNDVREVYLILDYAFVARYFAKQFYSEGLLSKYFHTEDMRRWNTVLTLITEGAETYVTQQVEHWRENKTEKKTVFKALKHEKQNIEYAKKMTEYILARLQESKRKQSGAGHD